MAFTLLEQHCTPDRCGAAKPPPRSRAPAPGTTAPTNTCSQRAEQRLKQGETAGGVALLHALLDERQGTADLPTAPRAKSGLETYFEMLGSWPPPHLTTTTHKHRTPKTITQKNRAGVENGAEWWWCGRTGKRENGSRGRQKRNKRTKRSRTITAQEEEEPRHNKKEGTRRETLVCLRACVVFRLAKCAEKGKQCLE